MTDGRGSEAKFGTRVCARKGGQRLAEKDSRDDFGGQERRVIGGAKDISVDSVA